MNIRNEIKAHIVQEGMTMSEVVRTLAVVHGWSASVPNLSDKLKRAFSILKIKQPHSSSSVC